VADGIGQQRERNAPPAARVLSEPPDGSPGAF
jgi:hypothetical protein